jgi:hypothetical protein
MPTSFMLNQFKVSGKNLPAMVKTAICTEISMGEEIEKIPDGICRAEGKRGYYHQSGN